MISGTDRVFIHYIYFEGQKNNKNIKRNKKYFIMIYLIEIMNKYIFLHLMSNIFEPNFIKRTFLYGNKNNKKIFTIFIVIAKPINI